MHFKIVELQKIVLTAISQQRLSTLVFTSPMYVQTRILNMKKSISLANSECTQNVAVFVPVQF